MKTYKFSGRNYGRTEEIIFFDDSVIYQVETMLVIRHFLKQKRLNQIHLWIEDKSYFFIYSVDLAALLGLSFRCPSLVLREK